jgi:hypothetical protein
MQNEIEHTMYKYGKTPGERPGGDTAAKFIAGPDIGKAGAE